MRRGLPRGRQGRRGRTRAFDGGGGGSLGRLEGTHTGNVESLSGLQCARARKNFFRGRDVPWLFTGTISVRSRFTGPTPVARFSIAVVIARKVRARRLRERKKKRKRSRRAERETRNPKSSFA